MWHVQGSSISCGVRRLVLDKEVPSKNDLEKLIKQNHCAFIMTSVPVSRHDAIALLLDSGFEQVKNPGNIKADNSVNPDFTEMAASVMYHDHEAPEGEDIDKATIFERFVKDTVNTDLNNMAASILHHGNEIIGKSNFFVYSK